MQIKGEEYRVFYTVKQGGAYAGYFSDHSFSDHNGESGLQRARAFVQRYLDGCPDNEMMHGENREYWKKVGREMRIYRVEQHSKLID